MALLDYGNYDQVRQDIYDKVLTAVGSLPPLANDRYIPVAVGRDSYDAAPQRGSFKGDDPGNQPVVNISIGCQ